MRRHDFYIMLEGVEIEDQSGRKKAPPRSLSSDQSLVWAQAA
jgi:hypothetical protein